MKVATLTGRTRLLSSKIRSVLPLNCFARTLAVCQPRSSAYRLPLRCSLINSNASAHLSLLTNSARFSSTAVSDTTDFVVTPDREITAEQLDQLLKTGEIILVDVREPKELEENGKIAQSINIPREWRYSNRSDEILCCFLAYSVGQVQETMALSAQTFEKLYGKKLEPEKLVFHCRAGVRSVTAMAIVQKEFGFNRSFQLKIISTKC